jgi:hypothetical protein
MVRVKVTVMVTVMVMVMVRVKVRVRVMVMVMVRVKVRVSLGVIMIDKAKKLIELREKATQGEWKEDGIYLGGNWYPPNPSHEFIELPGRCTNDDDRRITTPIGEREFILYAANHAAEVAQHLLELHAAVEKKFYDTEKHKVMLSKRENRSIAEDLALNRAIGEVLAYVAILSLMEK